MSSNHAGDGIPFAIGLDPQPIRLIELPPSLLEEVSSKGSTLELKSSTDDANGNAVLCSPTQTFSVRQNQSSNSLFISQIVPVSPSTSSSNNGTAAKQPLVSLRAVAQPKGMLEITPTRPDAISHFRRMLPMMNKETMSSMTEGASLPSSRGTATLLSKDDQLQAAPFSRGEGETALEQVCGFELRKILWQPSAALAVEAWKALDLSTEAVIESPGELQAFVTLPTDLDATDLPESLVRAVAGRVAAADQGSQVAGSDRLAVDKDRCISWVGDSLLMSKQGSRPSRDEFIAQWQDLLPSAWRDSLALDKLTVPYSVAEDDRIEQKLPDSSTAATSKVPAKVNKWHERLKATRK